MHHIREHLQALAITPEEKTIQSDSEAIELTSEEMAEAIRVAKEKKLLEQRKREYWEKITAEPEKKSYTWEQLFVMIKNSRLANGKKYIIDRWNEEQIILLCKYFADDPSFEENGRSLSKGIILQGGLGVGKTHLMALFFQNQKASYAMVQCGYIENKWVNAGKDDLDPIKYYSGLIPAAVNSNPFGHRELGFCFDDLGTETSPSKRFGEDKNVMAEILLNRYAYVKDYKYTHLTTNLTPTDIDLRYGDRIRDRIREMFNQITFDGDAKSRRV
jgi:DNA replication protein DnaC